MSAFPGLEDPLIALSLLAIDPELKGVLIAGPPGTGKTSIGRASKALFPQGAPFVNIPLGCSIDRLVGGIDLEATHKTGELQVLPGLLSRAHGGVIYIDEINLLPADILNTIVQALTSGQIHLEREGLSKIFPAKFVLIGTYNPEEGDLPATVTERVAFRVWAKTLSHLAWRLFLVSRRGVMPKLPFDVIKRVSGARKILPLVKFTAKQIHYLCSMASQSGVEGNRAEWFAYRCAQANAALHLRVPVTESDLNLAIKFIYISRLGSMPLTTQSDVQTNNPSQKSLRKQKAPDHTQDQSKHNPDKNPKQSKSAPGENDKKSEGRGDSKKVGASLDPFESSIKKNARIDMAKINATKIAGQRIGKHTGNLNVRRGRYIRAVQGDPRQGKIDILATMMAALRYQSLAGLQQNRPLEIKKEHYRIKQYRQKSGLLFLFAVDGSGSMAVNNYGAAKGAALSLLEKAYVYRDQVAMMFFRRDRADVLLSPGSSLTQAYRVLKRIPAGGRTPLGTAMIKCLQITKKSNLTKDVSGVVLILLTDGRANQTIRPLKEHEDRETVALNELKPICVELSKHLCAALVIDTKRYAYNHTNGIDIATWLKAEYLYMPKALPNEIEGEIHKLVVT